MFANMLSGLGVGQGDRVFSLLGRVPELYVAALGTLKNTSGSPASSATPPSIHSVIERTRTPLRCATSACAGSWASSEPAKTSAAAAAAAQYTTAG
jgi:acyl-coenzyme A synthetase/AMP-(fatty) acid ligase